MVGVQPRAQGARAWLTSRCASAGSSSTSTSPRRPPPSTSASFGLRGEFTAPDGSYAQLDTGSTRLAFASYALGEHNFAGGVRRAPLDGLPPNVELALVHEDVDAAFARALEAGCAGLSEPHDEPRGQRVAYVRDPFGTLVELASPM